MRTAVVVDDDPITRLDLSQMLGEIGVEVVHAVGDGFDAVSICERLRPDIVLMDINMPIFDGLSASDKIITAEWAKCVIVVSGYASQAMITRAAQLGVAGWVIKPVDKRQLLPTIEVALADANRTAEQRRKIAELNGRISEMKCIERAKGLLAAQQGITEAEAYRSMQTLAMEKRCTIAQIARRLVESVADRESINRAKAILMKQRGVSESAAYKLINTEAQRQGKSPLALAREIIATGE